MTTRVKYQNWAVDGAGDTVGSASITVTRAVTGLSATLYSGATGSGTKTNPFNSNSNGSFEFWVDPDEYDIEIGVSPTVTVREYLTPAVPGYATKAALEADVASGQTWPVGAIVWAAGVPYRWDGTSTSITNLNGFTAVVGDTLQEHDAALDGLASLGAVGAAGKIMVSDGSASWVYEDLVGTVSQSGGTPTGAVIERGSNANGEYVRFADGTQICTRTTEYDGLDIDIASGSLYRHDGIITHSSTMPAAFTSVDTAGVEFLGSDKPTIRNNLVTCRFGYFQEGTTYTPWSGLQIFTTSSAAGTAGEKTTVKAWAIGRWF